MQRDTGTPELRARHHSGQTMETLDAYVKRAWITEEEHRAALHFRWLHALKFGVPGPAAVRPHLSGGWGNRDDSPCWREAREKEYDAAVALLKANHAFEALHKLVIFNEPLITTEERASLREGLALLSESWRRRSS